MSELPSISEFRKYRNPSSSSPKAAPDNCFGDIENQAVIHRVVI